MNGDSKQNQLAKPLTWRPRRGQVIASILAAVLLAAVAGWTYSRVGAVDSGIGIGGPFNLIDGTGRAVTDKTWPGKYLLVYFGYTYCPDVCPTTLNDLAGALQKLGAKADRVQPIFITVDPRRDTPKVIAAYTAAFTPRLVGLTGTAEQIAQVTQGYRVYYAQHRTGPGPDDYSMDHSSIIYLIAPDGHFVSAIGAEQPADGMAAEIAKHLS